MGVADLHYGLLAFADLEWELQSKNQCREEYKEATAVPFRKWAVKLEGRVSGSTGREYSVWIFSTPFCAMQYMNDLPYPEGAKKETGR